MNRAAWLGGVSFALLVAIGPAWGADDKRVEDLALCRESWVDWKKTNLEKLTSFATFFRTAFTHNDNDPFVTPKSPLSIAGMNVTQVFPESVGMGVGFSVLVEAKFDAVKQVLEQKLGKKLGQCETGDDMRMCGLEIAAERTVTLMSGVPPNDKTSLIGCYYFYEK